MTEQTRGRESDIEDLAATIAAQADALAERRIPEGQRYAQVQRLKRNVEMLESWVGDDRR